MTTARIAGPRAISLVASTLPPVGASGEVDDMLALIADRADKQLLAYATAFREAGYDVTFTENAESALAEVSRSVPDFVLMRVAEPIPESLDLCRRIRTGSGPHHVLVIVLTEFDDPDMRDRIIGAGATTVIRTPTRHDMVLLRVRRLLAVNRLHRGPQRDRRPREHAATASTGMADERT